MSALRALWFAWGAVVALLAYPAHAQVIGQESAILGGEDGFFRPTGGGESTVTIDAMPYTRTVTCDTYTVTGTFTGTAPTGWSASPSGDTGSCTDLGSGTFSCVVDVDPDASGEGVETITIGSETVDIGFYVAGSHSCFLAQSVDGLYNSTLADNDAVATWENLGSSALDVTQGTAANQPTFKTGIVGGNPVVRCDGGDSLGAATASDWNFMNDGTDYTIGSVFINNGTNYTIASSRTSNVDGFVLAGSTSVTPRFEIDDATLVVVGVASVATMIPAVWHSQVAALDDDGSTGDDAFLYLDGALHSTGAATTAYPPSAGRSLLIGTGRLVGGGAVAITGDFFRVIIYQSALTSTQRGINQDVDEWALGGTLPVTTPTVHVDASDLSSITSPDAPVTAWINTVDPPDTFIEATNPPTHSGTGASAQVDFDGVNDKLEDSTFIWSRSPTAWHIIAVVTPDVVTTNGTGANCYLNDTVINDGGPYRGLFFRSSGGVDYAIAYNWDGTADCAETPITVGKKQVLDASLSGGDVRIGVNGGALTSTASGATTVSPASVQIGKNKSGSQFFDGKVHEIYFVPAALSAVDRANLVDSLMQKWEVTP